MKKKLPLLEAVAVLVGTTIGAGILGLPYAIYQTGFLTGLALLTVIFLAVLLLNLQVGEIVSSTKGVHQLTGYAEKYLGKAGKYAMFGSAVFGFYGALLAYIIGEGRVLAALTGGNSTAYSLLFLIFAGLLVYLGLKVIEKAELLMTMAILAVIIGLTVFGLRSLNWENLTQFNLLKILIPYGVILFAMGGFSAIPQQAEVLKAEPKKLKQAIILGTSIPFAVYVIFTFIVIGITGGRVTEVASIGLGEALGKSMIIGANIFAFFIMSTSFLTLGLALKNTYQYDFKIKHLSAWLLTILVPLAIFLLGFNDFEQVLGLVGSVGGGAQGILVGLMFLRLKRLKEKQPAYQLSKSFLIFGLLSLVFIGGIVYTLWFL